MINWPPSTASLLLPRLDGQGLCLPLLESQPRVLPPLLLPKRFSRSDLLLLFRERHCLSHLVYLINMHVLLLIDKRSFRLTAKIRLIQRSWPFINYLCRVISLMNNVCWRDVFKDQISPNSHILFFLLHTCFLGDLGFCKWLLRCVIKLLLILNGIFFLKQQLLGLLSRDGHSWVSEGVFMFPDLHYSFC